LLTSWIDVSGRQEEGFRLISEALAIDERETSLAEKAPAVHLYEKGIAELEKGVALFIPVPYSHTQLLVAGQHTVPR
jgi:hypothetical protein